MARRTETPMSRIVVGMLLAAGLAAAGFYAGSGMQKRPPVACSGDTAVFIPTDGGELLLGKIGRTQTFSTRHVLTVAGIPVSACKSTSSITIPSTTSYKVKLEKQWKVLLRADALVVIAPRVAPLLPVAFDTSGIRKDAEGCVLLSSQKTLDALERQISNELRTYAESAPYNQLARDAGRKVVAQFVRNWLVKQRQYEHAAGFPIKVFFEGEPITYY